MASAIRLGGPLTKLQRPRRSFHINTSRVGVRTAAGQTESDDIRSPRTSKCFCFRVGRPLSLGFVGLVKVISFIGFLMCSRVSFPVHERKKGRVAAERGESSAARRMSLQSLCHLTAVFTVVYRGERDACWDGAVVSQLKLYGGRLSATRKTPALRFQAHTWGIHRAC